jgi:hypothetical protein
LIIEKIRQLNVTDKPKHGKIDNNNIQAKENQIEYDTPKQQEENR